MADNIIKTDDLDSYFLLKGRFKGTETNTFGLFLLFISTGQKAIDNVLVAASHFSSIYDTPPSSNWDILEEKINQLKWKGEVSMNTSQELQLLFSNSLRPDMIDILIDAIKENKTSKIEHTLLEIIAKGIGDKSATIEFRSQKVTHSDILKVKDERARKEKEEKQSKEREALREADEKRFSVEDGGVVLPVSLVLAPVSGVPIYDIKENNAIMIKIDGSSEKGNYFIDLLKARTSEGEILPVKGIVKEIYMNALGEFELLFSIGPGIYGKTVESETVKVKLYHIQEQKIPSAAGSSNIPSDNTETESVFSRRTNEKSSKDMFIWIIGGITFLLAILLFYLIFSGLL